MKHTVRVNVKEHGEAIDIEVTVTEGLTVDDAIEYMEMALEILLAKKEAPHLTLVKG